MKDRFFCVHDDCVCSHLHPTAYRQPPSFFREASANQETPIPSRIQHPFYHHWCFDRNSVFGIILVCVVVTCFFLSQHPVISLCVVFFAFNISHCDVLLVFWGNVGPRWERTRTTSPCIVFSALNKICRVTAFDSALWFCHSCHSNSLTVFQSSF